MCYQIAINGYGRIGRCILRAFYESDKYPGLKIAAINDIADTKTLAHLTQYDSTHGRFLGTVAEQDNAMVVNQDVINVSNESQLCELPWRDLNIDLVMECSGTFTARSIAEQHLIQGAKKVLLSQPAESDVDATLVYGVNHKSLDKKATIISNASCTTNCIVPVLSALDDRFGVDKGVITIIHSAMNDQPVIDGYHHNDLRRTRSAMQSIIPVDTGLAKGIERIFPHLAGALEAQAIRVPILNVSAIDLTVSVNTATDRGSVNKAMLEASEELLPNVMGVTEEPLASCDFNHDLRSAIVDLSQTRVAGVKLIKLLIWFDNEWAYANRMLDVAKFISTQNVD
ncbi:MAG: glyceraldehyde 3-phosphate dehydrogenase NAD-binding domain-containing protein [Gammaproteobacteria bacterium]|nr:glyceraldehyde 3-phosphate dehydrogenase NAD-binding domain-containing protein [Gammaproteobacteria bacterium]